MAKKKTPYRSKVKIGVDANGKDIVKYIQGYTRAELARARKEVIAIYITGEAPAADRLFGDYAVEWFRVRKEPFISASSREAYRTALNKHLFPVLGDRNLRAITPLELQELLNGFAGKSKSLITSILATLRGIYGAALADRIVTRDPTERLVRPPATPTAVKPALTAEQRAALAAACASEPMGHYLALLYYLGCRPGEARGLMWQDVDWDRGLVHITRDIDYKASGQPGALKNKASDRHVPMPAPLRAILQPLRGLPDTYIAHAQSGADKPLPKSSADRLWVNLMASAGLAVAAPDDGKFEKYDPRHKLRPLITPHALRHNYITMCWEHGLDPYETMKLVGHASITTTMDIYTHLSEAQMSKTAAKLDDMFAGPRVASKLHRPG